MIGVLKNRFTQVAKSTPGGDAPVRWIVIAIVSWAEAEVMRSKLESEGIPCLLQREPAGAVFGISIGPLGEVRVLVPEPLADQAIDLLSHGADIPSEEGEDLISEDEWAETGDSSANSDTSQQDDT
ncbi:MAG: hypothetical protein M1546_12975 [Chloroflexi bacterium]|nr:hypothetical protein [Chloroflexota bacterium]